MDYRCQQMFYRCPRKLAIVPFADGDNEHTRQAYGGNHAFPEV